MSWGERSCEKPCRCPEKCSMETCNVDCPQYIWDKKTKPDSIKKGYFNKSILTGNLKTDLPSFLKDRE